MMEALASSIERALHGFRRRAALERLLAFHGRSMLFVCEGNLFRSPFAAALLQRELSGIPGIRVDSAGFGGPGRPVPPPAIDSARTRGIDLGSHRSKLLNGAMIHEWELVLVMEPRQVNTVASRYGYPRQRILVLGDLDPQPIDRRAILDPWGQPAAAIDASFDRVERCVRALHSRLPYAVDLEAAGGEPASAP